MYKRQIQASVIQGSALGPASYIVTAADLHPVYGSNRIFKFADDTYLVVPGDATHTCKDEIAHMQAWAAANNLVAARYLPRDGCLAHSVRGASVVGHVLGGGPHATRLTVAPQQTARLL